MTRRQLLAAPGVLALPGPAAAAATELKIGEAFQVGAVEVLILGAGGVEGREQPVSLIAIRSLQPVSFDTIAIVTVARRSVWNPVPDWGIPVLRFHELVYTKLYSDAATLPLRDPDFPPSQIAGIKVQLLRVLSEHKAGDFKP